MKALDPDLAIVTLGYRCANHNLDGAVRLVRDHLWVSGGLLTNLTQGTRGIRDDVPQENILVEWKVLETSNQSS